MRKARLGEASLPFHIHLRTFCFNLRSVVFLCIALLFNHQPAHSKIIHINRFEQILEEIDPDTLVLLDIDQTLIDSTLTVGGANWNRYMKRWIDCNMPDSQLYGWITYWIAHQVPVKVVESSIPSIVQELQSKHVVLGLTARGEANWHHATVPKVDLFTHAQLGSVGICLEHPRYLEGIPGIANGVIFTSQKPKGPFLKKILPLMPMPKKIVFVDDNIQQLRSVEEALGDMSEIVFVGCHYTFSEDTSPSLDPLEGLVQLSALLFGDSNENMEPSLPFLLRHFQEHIAPAFQSTQICHN